MLVGVPGLHAAAGGATTLGGSKEGVERGVGALEEAASGGRPQA